MKEVGRAAVFGIQGQDHKRTDQAHDLGCLGSCFEALYGLLPDYVTSHLLSKSECTEKSWMHITLPSISPLHWAEGGPSLAPSWSLCKWSQRS